MKQRQEVPRTFAVAVLVAMAICILLILLGGYQAHAQVKPKKMETSKDYHVRLQKQNSWATYQGTYKAKMIDTAKSIRKQRKEQEQAEKERQKFLARIERIKNS